jgi:LacI family transcriptional regulator
MGIEHPFHDFDNYAYAAEAVGRLAELGRRRLTLVPPPSHLSYYHHMRDGFAEALAEHGLSEAPFPAVNLDNSIDTLRARTAELMRRKARPDGIVSGAGAATFALVAGVEDAGFRVGSDIDIVSKQASRLLHLLRPQIHVVNEDVRLAGSELARAVMARIAGVPVASLQSLSRPAAVESCPKP